MNSCETVDDLYLALIDHTRSFGLDAQIRHGSIRIGSVVGGGSANRSRVRSWLGVGLKLDCRGAF